jgi:hypothetical protein
VALIVLASAIGAGTAAQKPGAPRSSPWPGDRFDVMEKTIAELQDAMKAGTVTSGDLVDIYFARIGAYDRERPAINALISLNPRAREEAAALDRERATRGPRGPLHGIPVVVKDNFEHGRLPTTAGSLALADLRPTQDAYRETTACEAGGVILEQNQSARACVGNHDDQFARRANPQPVRSDAQPRWVERRHGCGDCRELRGSGSWHGYLRVHPDPRFAQRARRLATNGWTLEPCGRHPVVALAGRCRTTGARADVALLLDATVGVDAADETTKAGEDDGRRYREALRSDALKGARIGVLTVLFGETEDNEGAPVRHALRPCASSGGRLTSRFQDSISCRRDGVIDAEFKFDLMDYLGQYPECRCARCDILDRGFVHPPSRLGETSQRCREPRDGCHRRARTKRDTLRQAIWRRSRAPLTRWPTQPCGARPRRSAGRTARPVN